MTTKINGKTAGQCSGCKASIYWVVTTAGQRIPVDVQLQRMVVDTPAGWSVRRGHVPHWSSCPQADFFRGPGGDGE